MAESQIERFYIQREAEKANQTGDLKRLEAAQIRAEQLPAGQIGLEILGTNKDKTNEKDPHQNRLNEQAALILTMDEILSKISVPSSDATDQSSELITPKNRVFKNFTPIRSLNNDKTLDGTTGHSFFTKTMTKSPAMKTFFKKIPPQVMSFLIPSIKVYKTFYPVDQFSTVNEKKIEGYDWRVPFDDIPVSYRGETSEYSVDNIEKILSGNGGLHSVGIKSFSYKYRGVNPAEVNTNIHASLSIFFQNPAELIKEINFDFNDPRFISNPPPGAYQTKLSFSYSDLVNQTSRTIGNSDVFNELYYRIKVECGYALPPAKTFDDVLESAGFDEKQKEEIKEAIITSRVTLFLTPYQYNVDFREEGSVLLNIEFTAAIDSIMSTPDADVFVLTEKSRELRKITDDYGEYIIATKKQKQLDKVSEKRGECLSQEETKKVIEQLKAKHPNIAEMTEEEVLKLLESEQATAYNSLFNFLIGKETIHADSISSFALNPKIYIAKLKPDIMGVYDSKKDDSKRQEAYRSTNQVLAVETIFDEQEEFVYGDGTKNEEKATNSLNKETKAVLGDGVCNVKFILLGDLLDLIFESVNYVKPLEDAPRIYVGGIPFLIPSKIFSENSSLSVPSEYVEITPNLADIPVSLNLLKEFLIKNIVKDKKTRYPTTQFLNDVLTQLIYPAISPTVFGDTSTIKSAIRFSTFHFTEPVENGTDPISGMPIENRNYVRFNEGSLSNNKRVVTELSSPPPVSGAARTGQKKKKFANYMFIVCTSKFPKNLNGDEDDDINNKGVLHFRMGTETGIIKKINFQKINMQYQREMIARREGKGKGTSLKQYYNATIQMFGNNIFRPGDFIYIHPNYMFIARGEAPESIDLESKLGFGGYYLIKDVETDINDMQFETKLVCLFQASIEREGTQKIVKPVNDDCNKNYGK